MVRLLARAQTLAALTLETSHAGAYVLEPEAMPSLLLETEVRSG